MQGPSSVLGLLPSVRCCRNSKAFVEVGEAACCWSACAFEGAVVGFPEGLGGAAAAKAQLWLEA